MSIHCPFASLNIPQTLRVCGAGRHSCGLARRHTSTYPRMHPCTHARMHAPVGWLAGTPARPHACPHAEIHRGKGSDMQGSQVAVCKTHVRACKYAHTHTHLQVRAPARLPVHSRTCACIHMHSHCSPLPACRVDAPCMYTRVSAHIQLRISIQAWPQVFALYAAAARGLRARAAVPHTAKDGCNRAARVLRVRTTRMRTLACSASTHSAHATH